MDNLTHTLAGIVLGRTLDRREGAAAGASVWAAVIASNIADIDIAVPPVLGGGKIEYLLHHRGWTHTLVLVPVLAVAAAAIAIGLRRWRRGESSSGSEFWRLSKIGAAGVTLHIAMDFLNSYGVHPFAPFSRSWIYGDSLFIAEPLMWWALLPFVSARCETHRARWAWRLAGGLPVGVLLFTGSLAAPVIAAAFAALSLFAQRRRPGTGVAWGGVAVVAVVFAAAGMFARSAVASSIAAGAPSERRLDIVTTPAPANPLCWRVESVGIAGDDYVAREGTVSLAPRLVAADRCFPFLAEETTAPLTPSTVPSNGRVEWRGEFRRTLLSFRDKAQDCRVAAMLGFMRVPYWAETNRRAIHGDLRFDFDTRESFGEVKLDPKKPYCLSVPWIPPRADVLYE